MKKLVLMLLAVCVALAVLTPAPGLAKGKVNLTFSIFLPEKHAQAQAAIDWAKEIEKRTNGDVAITIFAGGTLTKGPEVYEGVVNGLSDIGNSCFAYTRGRFPVMQAIDLPMGYPDGKVASQVADDFAKAHAAEDLKDVKLLYVHAHGPGLLHTQKPVAKLEDLAGMKIRSTGFSAEVVKALGGVPVAMGQGQAYEALKTGVVEGTITPIEALKGWKQAEVVKYTTECSAVGYTTAMYVIMNLNKWNSLSPEVQKVFEDVSSQWSVKHGQAWDEADDAGRAYTLEMGNKIIPLIPEENARWAETARPVIAKYEESVPNGKQYVEEIRTAIEKAAK